MGSLSKTMIDLNPTKLELLYTLMRYWEKNPYLRFCQIASNAFRIHPNYKRNLEPDINDIYYMSDKDFVYALGLLEESSKSKRSDTTSNESEHTEST